MQGSKLRAIGRHGRRKNSPGRLEIMIQEPIGELRIGLSATAVDPIPFFISMSR